MGEDSFTLLYRFRFVLGSALIIVCLFLLSFVLSLTTSSSTAHAAKPTSADAYTLANSNDNPNVVADFMSEVGNKTMQITSATQQGLSKSLHTITTSIVEVPVSASKVAGKGAYSGAKKVASGAVAVANGAGDTLGFVAHLPSKVVKMVSPSDIVSNTIQPANKITSVPMIDDAKSSPEEVEKALAAANPASRKTSPDDAVAVQWPIHGEITTLFGVPELPYEAIHTGLDISDGTYPGTTPIKPFKPGKVVEVIRGGGLGNHVVIDHGGGITSVYGHLYSISVHVGQKVDKNSIIGFEGSTGVSTGTHLHFEIHKNGQPVNPLDYIPGRP